MTQQPISPGRRFSARVESPEDVWVYWRCGGRDDTSRVRNLSLGGLFIETRTPKVVGAKTQVEFLVQEGQIRTDAVVRPVNPGGGVGLTFKAGREGGRTPL